MYGNLFCLGWTMLNESRIDWEPYTMEEEEPISYMIKDCSDSVEMTEQEVLKLVREKLGMNVMIKRT